MADKVSVDRLGKVEGKFEDPTNVPVSTTKPKKCPNCGHLNPWKRTECRKCKTPLPENVPTYVCPDCGYEVRVDADKCPYCDLPIDEVKARAKFVK